MDREAVRDGEERNMEATQELIRTTATEHGAHKPRWDWCYPSEGAIWSGTVHYVHGNITDYLYYC